MIGESSSKLLPRDYIYLLMVLSCSRSRPAGPVRWRLRTPCRLGCFFVFSSTPSWVTGPMRLARAHLAIEAPSGVKSLASTEKRCSYPRAQLVAVDAQVVSGKIPSCKVKSDCKTWHRADSSPLRRGHSHLMRACLYFPLDLRHRWRNCSDSACTQSPKLTGSLLLTKQSSARDLNVLRLALVLSFSAVDEASVCAMIPLRTPSV